MPWVSTNHAIFNPEEVAQANLEADRMREAFGSFRPSTTFRGIGYEAIDATAITTQVSQIPASELSVN